MANYKTPRSCGKCDWRYKTIFGNWRCELYGRLRTYKNRDGYRVPIAREPCKHRRKK